MPGLSAGNEAGPDRELQLECPDKSAIAAGSQDGGQDEDFLEAEVIILAIVLAAGSWLVFIWGLNLQMPVWPSFISG